jgi:DAK2 domain fusion protein YloV
MQQVNALNVFPVPDGDTGTNMNLTMRSGVQELKSRPSLSLGAAAEALSRGLLMGARGNSGVILSQLFRGFARGAAGHDELSAAQFAAALQQGVDTAYKSVVKPVEGTILTVAREAARHAVSVARRTPDVAALMREVLAKAKETLQRTPDMLPILKQVGVVDSGGQGLVYLYEGFAAYLSGEAAVETAEIPAAAAAFAPAAVAARPARRAESAPAQSRLATESIEFPYDMEFFIRRPERIPAGMRFDREWFTRALEKDGDSVIVIDDGDIIKVHVHSRKPGDVLNLALPYGELIDIRILNMREQHRELLEQEEPQGDAGGPQLAAPEVLTGGAPVQGVSPEQVHEYAPYGIIAVAMGGGIADIFLRHEADVVLSGGQTMNPSTEDFLQAIESLSAERIYLLPNNGNVILTAQQAAEMSGRSVTVIPTRSIPQGLAALLAFNEAETAERNEERMRGAAEQVRSGEVTLAVRDSTIGGLAIRNGDYIGILDKEIVAASGSLQETCRTLLAKMLEDGGELVTVLTGEGTSEEETAALSDWLKEAYPDAEVEVFEGGQPLYPYLIAVE